MKKSVTLMLLLACIVTAAEAKRRETPEEAAKRIRNYSGWEFGATGRVAFIFYELQHMKVADEAAVNASRIPKKQLMGGQIALNAGYFLNNRWKLGVAGGVELQYNGPLVPIYATVHHYYGKRKNCLFNYLNLGTNILFDHGMRMGGMAGIGGGYRMPVKDSKMNVDLTIGYQATLLRPRPVVNGNFSFERRDIKLQEINQMVYIGIGVSF